MDTPITGSVPMAAKSRARKWLMRDVALSCFRVFEAGYVRLVGRPSLQKLNLRFLNTTLRARGYNNMASLAASGEGHFLERVARMRPVLCIDVGANVGNYSRELLTRTSATVIAFEPLPKAFRQIEILRTGREERFIVFNCALGDVAGSAPITFGAEDSQIATLSQTSLAVDYVKRTNVNQMTVQVRRLDDLVASGELDLAGREIDLLKIDTEGYEYNVLTGAQQVIAMARPKLIQIEFNWHQLFAGRSLWDFAALLPGYDIYQLLPYQAGWHRIDPKAPESNVYCFSNFVFVRADVRLPAL